MIRFGLSCLLIFLSFSANAEPGPMPREVGPPSAEAHPAGAGGPTRAESRSAPPSGYSAVEVEGTTHPRRMPWTRLGTVAGGFLFLVIGFWVFRSRSPKPPESN
jgi:hypothetical protein